MSLFRLPKFKAITSTVQRIQDRFVRRPDRSVSERAYRSLQIDPLEERQLLSLTPANVGDIPINQTPIQAYFDDFGRPLTGTLAAQSLAVDHDGDFVVTWTSYDDVYQRDPSTGEIVFDLQTGLPIPVIDPATGLPMTDANIYARYFTDEVQRVSLPAAAAQDNTPSGMGGFTLHYGGNETQRISITATHKPAFDPLDPYFFGFGFFGDQEPIAGTFTLGFDRDGNGLIGANETTTIDFDEMPAIGETGVEHLKNTAATIQTGLQGLGGALADVTVEALDPHEYLIHFGDESKGLNQPELVLQGFNFTTGFLPAVRVTTVNEPVVLGPIPVSPDDPLLTAFSIEQAFAQTAMNFVIGPIDFPPENRAFNSGGDLTQGPYYSPQVMRTPMPEVSVTARSTTEFDIRFVGDAGKQNHPEMFVMSASDDYGNLLHDRNDPLLQSPEATVATLKQPSDEFRVNPIEVDNPYTILPDLYAQKAPSIAMDADGEFVIVWSSEVSDAENFGSVSDIYARRFAVTGVVDPSVFVPGQVVPGVRALAVPSAVDAQILTFDPIGAAPLIGPMQLRIGGHTTATIQFDSDDLDGVAAAIQAELVDAGYGGTLVTSTSTAAPYGFRVRFGNESAGIDQPPIEYVPVLDPILGLPLLAATVSVADEAPDLSTFRVNQMTTNAQTGATVGMDDAGNFVIAWANEAQDISFFNGISAQRFDRFGNRNGNEFQVNVEDTAIHFDPFVAMSADGHMAVTWSRTSDPDYLIPDPFFVSVQAMVLDPTGAVVLPQFPVGGAAGSSAAFDMNNNVLFAWDELADSDNIGVTSEGVYAIMYQIYDPATGLVDVQVIRDTFRASSASLDTTTNTIWPLWQGNAQAVVDADGDLLISYNGYGPDVSSQVSSVFGAGVYDAMMQALQEQINIQKNADLLPYFDPSFNSIFGLGSGSSSGDIDAIIESILVDALDSTFGTTPASNEQLGRLRAILDSVVGLLRGEANAAMFSRFDADPTNGVINTLFSDSVANAKRDGNNSRFLIVLDETISGGNFVLRFWHPYYAGSNDTAAINVPVYNNTTDVRQFDLAENIEAALEALQRTGVNWWDGGTSDFGEGGIDVRPVYTSELQQRQGTPWDMTTSFDPLFFGFNSIDVDDYVFEVTLQGELHDIYSYGYDLILAPNGNNLQVPGVAEVQTLRFNVTTDGWFALEIDTDESADILYDSTDPFGMANLIQAELIAMGNDDTTVTYMGLAIDGVTQLFEVTFDGASAGTDYDPITLIDANDHDVASGDILIDATLTSVEDVKGDDLDAPPPEVVLFSVGSEGTSQTEVSTGMEPDGDFVIAWTQQNNYTGGAGFGSFGGSGSSGSRSGTIASQSIFFRTFDESTDTAGPMITDLIAPSGKSVDPTTPIQGPLQHIVLVFDEELAQYDDETIAWAIAERELAVDGGLPITGNVSAILDSVTNVLNYRLSQNGAELPETILRVEFGMNMAAELADAYGLNPIPTNKWEAVITFDGNGVDPDSNSEGEPLSNGLYTIETLTPIPALQAAASQSGIRDKSGVPLNHTGFTIGGADASRSFVVVINSSGIDTPVTIDPPVGFGANGRTYPEVPGAVAVDSDGDHIVVWTAYDPLLERERVFVRTYAADGNPAVPRPYYFRVTNAFPADDQRYATVASDADGDFVVTWTNFRDADGDGIREEQDIYMQRFDSRGFQIGDPMRVNTYTVNDQKWSSVAMDVDGDFVVTWSSYSQEDNNQLGTGYGIYARQFDSFGQPLAPEFRVNVTTVGNQQVSSVAMNQNGAFVVAWTSDQNGVGDDIIARSFNANGSPQAGPLAGEILINQTTDGNQRYPDIATNLEGDQFVVTWSSSGQDGSGWGVYGRLFDHDLSPAGAMTPASPEFLANTTLDGNQMFSSVAMDYEGEFTIVWSGLGDQPGQEDTDPSGGVFYQRFGPVTSQIPIVDPVTGNPVLDVNGNPTFQTVINTVPFGQETRVNFTVAGSQQVPSIGSDADGNFVVAWTGTTSDPNITDVYSMVSFRTLPEIDTTGPIVTDVQQINRERILPNGVVSNLGELIVVFNEDLSRLDGDVGLSSVLNPNNWSLERNGTEIVGAIKRITFGIDTTGSRKYEARILLDGNGLEGDPDPLAPPQLPPGDYVLTARDLITDGVAALDGDYDSTPGTDPSGTGQDGFKFQFSVSAGPQIGAEFRINESTIYAQRLAEPGGTGYANEKNSRAMAVDHDGDFVVVWTSTGQDDPNDPYGAGVYFRMFDRNNEPLTSETRVNTTTAGHQLNASVAMDADGDFVVVWESEGHGPDNSSDIFGQRYDSTGNPLGAEFRVNTEAFTDQFNPAVAMDDFGNFAVVWGTVGQRFSYFNNIKGQVYDYAGRPIGEEFQVNETDLPGTGSGPEAHEANPTIAMDPAGNIIVAWEQVTAQQNGVVTDSDVVGRLFGRYGAPKGAEQAFSAGGAGGGPGARTARNPQLATDPSGNFIVVWESHNGTDYDIAYQLFDSAGASLSTGPISEPVFGGQQVNPSVAIDADGDFAIVWNGNGGQTDPLNPADPNLFGDLDNEGVFIRQFHAALDFLTVQSRVNRTQNGIQQFPTIGMEPDGDRIVVWSGAGVGDNRGIFARRYDEPLDTAGPLATELRRTDTGALVVGGDYLPGSLQQIAVVFDEEMAVGGAGSVLDLDNWTLIDSSGQEVTGAISHITFGLNPLNNKFEAVVHFNGAGLNSGYYELIVGEHATDLMGNEMRHSGLLPGGQDDAGRRARFNFQVGGFVPGPGMEFLVNQTTDGTQTFSEIFGSGTALEHSNRSLAVDHDGDFVVVWTSYDQDGDGAGVFMRMYDRDNVALTGETQINTFTAGDQRNAEVAIDADGDFVVVWESEGQDPDGSWGIYARRFNSVGQPIEAEEFRVTTESRRDQFRPAVAMDDVGNFVVVWGTTAMQLDYYNDIHGQLFDYNGDRLGLEFRVNDTNVPSAGGSEMNPAVAMNAQGDFFVAWEVVSAQYLGQPTDTIINARHFFADGTPQAAEYRADLGQGQGGQGVARTARNPQVMLADNGDYSIGYEHYLGVPGAGGLYTFLVQYYTFNGTPRAGWGTPTLPIPIDGNTNYVNTSFAIDADGNSLIVINGHWAQLDATDPTNPLLVTNEDYEGIFLWTSNSLVELFDGPSRVNRTEYGTQHFGSVGMTRDGSAVIVWSGYGIGDDQGIFARRYEKPFDMIGPMLTEVRLTDRTRVDAQEPVVAAPQELVVVFDEDMWTQGPDSVTNPANWTLLRNGVEMEDVISGITFSLNRATNKYEALLQFDAPLSGGLYTLTALEPIPDNPSTTPIEGRSGLRDASGNPISRTGLVQDGASVSHTFILGLAGGDTSVTDPWPVSGAATQPQTPGAVALDADGDHVVVLTATDLLTGREKAYVRMYDASGSAAQTAPVLFTVTPEAEFAGDIQRFATVASDADGDFIVTWTNLRDTNGDGTHETQDIYARRFNAMGQALGSAFRANDYTNGVQKWSSVAMDTDGDFVITWSSYGQDSDTGQLGFGYGVYARRYDSLGEPLADEVRVNTTLTGDQQFASVAMNTDGDFVVTWTSNQGGVDNDIYARAFDAATETFGPETLVNTTVGGDQLYSDIAMNLTGNSFVVTWSGSASQDGDGFGVFARQFTRAGNAITAATAEIQVNTTTLGDQQFASAAMDHDGDFVVAWSGFGDQQFQEDASGSGVFFQRFDSAAAPIDGETRATITTEGHQWAPSIASDGRGNFAIVFTGNKAATGSTDVYRFLSTNYLSAADNDGPLVTDVLLDDGTRLLQGETVPATAGDVTQLIVLFSEDLSTRDGATGPDSVLNPANWKLYHNGTEITAAITGVTFGRQMLSRKYQALITLDGNGMVGGTPALSSGQYVLTVRDSIHDVYTPDVDGNYFGGNALDGDFDAIPGATTPGLGVDGFRFQFDIDGPAVDTPLQNGRTHAETPGAVAVDADGDHVVVTTVFDANLGRDRIYLQLFNANGQPAGHAPNPIGVTPTWSNPEFNNDDQRFGSVAIDADGDFVVTWTNIRNGEYDVYARRFNSMGTSLDAPFRVNTYTNDVQKWSDVAVDLDGDFVITWSSYGQEEAGGQLGYGSGVYARRYNSFGVAMGPEMRVNLTVVGNQQYASVAMDADGDFVVAWTSEQSGPGDDIFARAFSAAGVALGDEIPVNTTTVGEQRYPNIATDLAGQNFIITWSSSAQDGSGWGVFARRFTADPTTGIASATGEISVNTTVVGNQMFSAAAMDHQGDFVIVWSGTGDQPLEQDEFGSGVFYQRFDNTGTPIGGETRANYNTAGNQMLPSIGSDGTGNVVIAWMGDGATPGSTSVYKMVSSNRIPVTDVDGPLVTDIFLPDGTRVLEGDVLENRGITTMLVAFGENLSTDDGVIGPDSVLNPSNWTLERNGNEILNGIAGITFSFNPATRKHEAVLSFDGNGQGTGISELPAGHYTLIIRDDITDGNNPLDTDFDGVPGTNLANAGLEGYRFSFFVAEGPQFGPEYRVNGDTALRQQIGTPHGTGTGVENSTRAMALDHDGDFVVVWTSYGKDDPSDADGAGVFYRMYDRNDVPLTDVTRVNQTTVGNQWRPEVAIDPDGEFVVVWQADAVDPDGSNAVFARRYSSIGQPLGGEFRVNTTTLHDQANPAVAMDDDGNFLVAWGTSAQQFGYFNDIRGQLFNNDGDRTSPEFLVNSVNIPGIAGAPGGSWEVRPAVAMDSDGNFMVAWDQLITQTNGVVLDGEVAARMFDATAAPLAAEFVVATGGGTPNRPGARNPQLTADRAGNYTIVWEAYNGTDYDVFYQQYDATGAGGAAAQLNQVEFVGDQVNPSVSIDDNGRMAVVWNGNGGQTDPLNPGDPTLYGDLDGEGVFVRLLDETAAFITVQSRVNRTVTGIQHFPTIGMEPDGDRLVVWGGSGVGDRDGIYVRRYDEPLDTVGPQVTGIMLPSGRRIPHDQQINEPLYAIILVFDEEMMTSGASSVTDPRNYRLLHDDTELLGGIREVHFGLNKASQMAGMYGIQAGQTNKWEAVLLLDVNGNGPGVGPLVDGRYEILAMNSLRDVTGNPLNSTGLNPNGNPTSKVIEITVPSAGEIRVAGEPVGGQFTQPLSPQAVAEDADGDYVVVWTSTTPGSEGVWARTYDVDWITHTQEGRKRTDGVGGHKTFLVSAGVAGDTPSQAYASVARDIDGDFVVTWSSRDVNNNWDVYARRYDASGNALGETFIVNAELGNDQMYSSVAMDGDGDFVVTWQSFDQDGSGWGIYAQRYDPEGNPIGGANELQVIRFVGRPTGTFKLSWDHDGLPFTPDKETAEITFTGNTAAVVEEIENKLIAIGADVALQAVSQTEIAIRFVGADAGKDRAQIWVSDADMTGDPGAQVQIYTAIDGSPGEFRVNDTTENNQRFPVVSMNAIGGFVVTWTSAGQDGDAQWETNIYAKQFPSNDVIRRTSSQTSGYQSQWDNWIEGARYTPFIVSVDDPLNHVVVPGSGSDGVVELTVFTFFGAGLGSGTLLSSGTHILTAAHVVADPFGNLAAIAIDVAFDLPTGRVVIPASNVFIHPDYNGNPFTGNDIAIITLAGSAPTEAERHDIYRGSDELGRIGTKYGYGMNGTGNVGSIAIDGLKRVGQNEYESFGGLLGASDMLLVYDFDNGLPQNDAFGQKFNMNDLGLGLNEVSAAPGDSGGPTFIDGLIASVVTGGISLPGPHDMIAGIQSSFGDFGVDTRVSIFADWIDQVTTGTPEFLVNQTIAGDQKWSAVALDSSGDFVITWTGYGQDLIGEGYGPGFGGEEGIFARRYHSSGFPGGIVGGAADEFQVNTFAQNDQQHSRVVMDADGDFVITWESFQDRDDDTAGPEAADSFGIYAQRYAKTERLKQTLLLDDQGFPVFDALGNPIFVYADSALGPNGSIGGELAINTTKAGDQRYPGVGIDDTGDILFVWSGNGEEPGQGSAQGVFYQRYDKTADEAGPTVGDVLNVADTETGIELDRVKNFEILYPDVTRFVITFGENLSTEAGASGEHSVLNWRNWGLTKDGVGLSGSIATIEFGLSKAYPALRDTASNKYEAVITFDGNPLEPGLQPLESGTYELTIRDAVQDLFGNPLDGDFDGSPNGNFRRSFTVYSGTSGNGPGAPDPPTDPNPDDVDLPINGVTAGDQEQPTVASNAAGDHVIAWVTRDALGEGNIMGQRFDRFGQPIGNEFLISTEDVGNQTDPDVAMDAFGNFVVAWSGEGPNDTSGIFARAYDAFGVALGDQFRVNQLWQSDQTKPSAAMDQNGDFVISFTSVNQEGDDHAIYARRFNFLGQPLSTEFRVNTTTHEIQDDSDVAMDANGNFVAVWASFNQDGGSWGIFGQRFDASGQKIGSEFAVNSHRDNRQVEAQIAMDLAGNFVVTWSSFLQDGDGYGIYARRFSSNAMPLDSSEFLVNQTTYSWQRMSAVGMDDLGNFVITWTSTGQDNVEAVDEGVYARMYNADGSDYLVPSTDLSLGEFRVNATVVGDQIYSVVSMDSDGDYVIAWVGPDYTVPIPDPLNPLPIIDPDPTDVYSRVIIVNPQTYDTNGSGGFIAIPEEPVDPTTVVVEGTAGDDLFEVGPGSTPGTWVVRLNGVDLLTPPSITNVAFTGLGGHDTVRITGTDADETAELWPTAGIVRSGNYSISFGDVESISVDAAGGNDELILYDSPGDDTFSAGPGGAAMLGDQIDIATTGFETVLAYATAGGTDVAKLFDSPGDDEFHSNPQYGQLSGDGFLLKAIGFSGTHGYATAGGMDVAKLFDSPADDTFYADPTEASLYGDGFYNRVKFFEAVHAYATSGGVDQAELHDSEGDDQFYGSATESSLYGDGFYNRAKGFDSVKAYATAGVDNAEIYDSPGDDTFSAGPGGASIFSDQIDIATFAFENVVGYAFEGGMDVAKLFDSPGDDLFHSNPQYGQLSGDGFLLKAVGFEGTHGYATAGGIDIAQMFDSTGDDKMFGNPTEASLYGDGYYNRVKYFEGVHAYADNGGFDLADLYGSPNDDTYDGSATQGALFGAGFYNRAKSFDQINVHTDEGGIDKAILHDITLTSGTVQPAGDFTKIDWLYDFEEYFTTEGDSDDLVEQAVDEILRAYWS